MPEPTAVIEGILSCEDITRGDGCYGCGGADFDEVRIDGKPLSEFEVEGDSLDWWPASRNYLNGREVRLRARIEIYVEDIEPATTQDRGDAT